jgi:hypothetical protein
MQIKRALPFDRDTTYLQRYNMLRADELDPKIDKYAWRNAAMSEAEARSRTKLTDDTWRYLKDEKFHSDNCDAIGSGRQPCNGAWPFCPKCPTTFPDCHNPHMSHGRLVELRRSVEQALAADPRPVPVPAL